VSDALRRFLHLERPRANRGTPAHGDPTPTPGRFDSVERPTGHGPGAPARSGAELDRFGPEPEPRIELVEADGRQPFTRCMRCGRDSGVFATECPGCTASLDTPAQHAFNETLWSKLQEEAAREARVVAERRAMQERAAAEDAAARRSAYEQLAREVGDAERRRLGGGRDLGPPWGWRERRWGDDSPPDPRPLAFRLLAALPEGRARIAGGLLLAAGLLGLVATGLAALVHGRPGTALGVAIALATLLLAPGWWRGRRL
jgi:hypothetical protein